MVRRRFMRFDQQDTCQPVALHNMQRLILKTFFRQNYHNQQN